MRAQGAMLSIARGTSSGAGGGIGSDETVSATDGAAETQQLHKKRSRIAEYVHMKIKSVWRLDRFGVRGLVKAGKEALWMAIAFNVKLMLTLRRQQAEAGRIEG